MSVPSLIEDYIIIALLAERSTQSERLEAVISTVITPDHLQRSNIKIAKYLAPLPQCHFDTDNMHMVSEEMQYRKSWINSLDDQDLIKLACNEIAMAFGDPHQNKYEDIAFNEALKLYKTWSKVSTATPLRPGDLSAQMSGTTDLCVRASRPCAPPSPPKI